MRTRRFRQALVIAALAVTTAACASAAAGPLSDAERAMAELDAGRIDLAFTATAGEGNSAGPVGFRMEGPFAIEDGREFPTFDLRYTTLLGDTRRVMQVVSDGTTMHVVQDGVRTPVPAQSARALRIGSGDGGFGDLGIAGWVEEASVEERGDGSRVVTGQVNAGDLLSDLARIAGQTAGAADVEKLDGDAARRIDRLVRHSELRAELDPAGLPRSLRAVIDFGQQPPDDLRNVLGPYATPRLEITLAVTPAAAAQ